MDFKDRLIEYRLEIGIDKKRDMASKLDISESYYNLLENGVRPPSKSVLRKLVLMSDKPEEFWLYGITDEKEYIEKREDFKCLRDAFEQLSEIGLMSLEKEFSDAVKEVITAAAIADAIHYLEKKEQKKHD